MSSSQADEPKLSNRGNKLTGQENPGMKRPQKYCRLRSTILRDNDNESDFENFQKMFIRKVKYNPTSSEPFVRFLNEFEAHKDLFEKEGITLDKIFKPENLAERPLSRYTSRALQSRHLEVLVTLLMLKIESEQEEYRKLMRLAEELCIEDFNTTANDGDDNEGEGGDVRRSSSRSRKEENVEMKEAALERVFQRESSLLEGLESEEVLQLKALCHEHLHQKRIYISVLRKIRSGAVYSLFQANGLYRKLRRLDRKLAAIRPTEEDGESVIVSGGGGGGENNSSSNK